MIMINNSFLKTAFQFQQRIGKLDQIIKLRWCSSNSKMNLYEYTLINKWDLVSIEANKTQNCLISKKLYLVVEILYIDKKFSINPTNIFSKLHFYSVEPRSRTLPPQRPLASTIYRWLYANISRQNSSSCHLYPAYNRTAPKSNRTVSWRNYLQYPCIPSNPCFSPTSSSFRNRFSTSFSTG